MLKNIELIIFDLDGTLVDAYRAIIKSFNYTLQKLGYSKKDDLTIRRAVGWGDENLLRPFLDSRELNKALSIYRKHHKTTLVKYSRLFPKVDIVLNHLRNRGYKLAIASNRPTRFSWILIRHLKIEKYFDYVLCADRLKHIKPHPEILNRIRQRFSLRPVQTLYVGDMTIDIQAGRRAKIKTISIDTGSNTIQELKRQRPYRIINRITDLLKIL